MIQFQNVEDYLEVIGGFRDITSGLRMPLAFAFSPIISIARYDNSVLDSMCQTATANKALTQKQGDLAVKIVLKYKRQLASKGVDITPIESNPKFRVPLRQMDYTRSLSLREDKLIAKFPYTTSLIEAIRGYKKDAQGSCEFDQDVKEWQFGLTEYNLNWIHTLAASNQFEISQEVNDLNDQMVRVEQTPYKIELTCNDGKLAITNCPVSLREYIDEKLGGFDLTNLERLVDQSGELCFTIDESLESAIEEQFGKLFLKIAKVKEAKFQVASVEKFQEIVNYALQAKRTPVIVYEPDMSGKLLGLLAECVGDEGIHMVSGPSPTITDHEAKFVYTTRVIKSMDYIPLLISSAGMIYGSDKQIMFQQAGKVIYFAADVYKGTTTNNLTVVVEKIDL